MVISCAVLTGLAGPIGPLKASAGAPVIDNASAPVTAPDVYGYVYDVKGNKVPNAHVTIYYANGTVMWIPDNPRFSGTGDDQGYYGFSGADVGDYTVKAEIVDSLGDVYNGTARAHKFDDRPVIADITIPKYVYSPWISPTPTPEPTAVVAPVIMKITPTVTPTAEPDVGSILNPLYAIIASPVIAAGALLYMRSKKIPAIKSGRQYVDIGRSQTFTSYAGLNGGPTIANGFSEYFLMNEGYSSEIEELVQSKVKYHYNDIAVIHRVENISKRYGIDEMVIYRDIKKVKTTLERGKCL